MSNEKYNQIIDDVYKNYLKVEGKKFHERTEELRKWATVEGPFGPGGLLKKEEFINKIKTDDEFTKKWGLKIDERELSLEERNKWFQINLNGNNPFMKSDWKDYELDQQNIPDKLITITYNNETIEVYE